MNKGPSTTLYPHIRKPKGTKEKRMSSSMKSQKIDRNSETTASQLDRISELPDSVLSRILFHLPVEDAARTTVLTKDWLRMWRSLPVRDFVFDQSLFENNHRLQQELEEKAKVQKFIDFVNESLTTLLRQKVIVQSFTLNLMDYRSYSCWLQNTIMDWLLLITKNVVKKLKLNEAATRPLIEAGTLWHHSELSQRLKCLQELSLALNKMMENEVKTGLDHILKCCSSLKTLIIKSHRNLNDLTLSKLCVENVRVENIQSLKLSHATRHRIQISSRNLQRLEFCRLEYAQHFGLNVDTRKTSSEEVVIDINAPMLRQLSYSGDILVSFTFLQKLYFPKISCRLTISPCHVLNTSWFIQLRNYLDKLSEKFSGVDLTINSHKDALFRTDEIMNLPARRRHFSGHLNLRINCIQSLPNYEGLIDGLLWSCCPDFIEACASGLGGRFLQFFIGELVKTMTKETISCCKDPRGFRCWRHFTRLSEMSYQGGLLNATLHW